MRRATTLLTVGVLLFATGCSAAGSTAASSRRASATRRPTPSGQSSASPSPSASVDAPKAPPAWSDVFSRVTSGVVKIDVSTCDTTAEGTGFLIGPDLIATVAHVVEGTSTIRVTSPATGTTSAARVIGLDHDHDLALLQTFVDFPGHQFQFASAQPALGTDMAVLGYSLGRSIRSSIDNVTGLHDHREVGDAEGDDGYDLSDVTLTGADINPGDSGGPWINRQGRVIALTESGPPFDEQSGDRAQGENGGVPATTAGPIFQTWTASPQSSPGGACADTSDYKQAVRTLDIYFFDIDNADYDSAYAQLNPAHSSDAGRQAFLDAEESSDISDGSDDGGTWTLLDSGETPNGPYVDAQFISTQDPTKSAGGDQACTRWTLRYTFVLLHGLYLIDAGAAIPGKPEHQAC